tara:strand:- start:6726 stop:8231 length:1506 start_codon:yes stop_codon:yes gene_type:complete
MPASSANLNATRQRGAPGHAPGARGPDPMTLDLATLRGARLSRDPRFDGRFFVAVLTTGIFCRPICPARLPREDNVRYYESALGALQAGYRPCLRCRPDSAPGSPAWQGCDTTLKRALALIDQGALDGDSIEALATRLGIGARHLRGLFQRHLGVSPSGYAQHRRCLFAKQLLHESNLAIGEVALASGFGSVRRFNEVFRERIGLSPRDIRRHASSSGKRKDTEQGQCLSLTLGYRPPYDFAGLRDFFARRAIRGLEWVGDDHYGRRFRWRSASGRFTAIHQPERHGFRVELVIDDLSQMTGVVANIRRMLDLDALPSLIDATLRDAAPSLPLVEGLRLPGLWSPFEAAVRAVLGQQVSVVQARALTQTLVDTLGERTPDGGCHFPTAAALAGSPLCFLGMPDSRRQTLCRLAEAVLRDQRKPPQWEDIRGIGPWTAGYARLRGESEPDVWLAGDAVIRRVLSTPSLAGGDSDIGIDIDKARPWRSYLLLQLWSHDHDNDP